MSIPNAKNYEKLINILNRNAALQGFLKAYIENKGSQSTKGRLLMPKSYKGHKIEKRRDNRYQARFRINGKQYTLYAKTQDECYKKLKETIDNKKIIVINKNYKFHEYIDTWYKTYKEPKISNIYKKTAKSIISKHIKTNIANYEMNKITPLIINEGLNKVTGRPKEYTSQYLREIFKQAYQDKIIKTDIHESILKYTHKRKEGTALTQEQRTILIEKCKNFTDGEIILFYLYTGCRKSEALQININDIDENTIRIPGTKTLTSNRIIPIFKPLKPIIKKLLEKTKNNKLINITEITLKRRIIELREKCKFHFTIKDLRTTFGTICAEQNINDSVIAKWLGHSNTNTTKKYYIKVLSDFEIENATKLDTYFDTQNQ